MAPPTTLSIPLRGPAGEPVDFRRTALSHGLTSVVPFAVDEGGHALRAVVRLLERSPRVVELRSGSANACQVSVGGSSLDAGERRALETVLERMLALDTDLTAFYELSATDPLLSWAPAGAGRIVRSQTVFEDVIRTICTTNCAFSATRRMIKAAVEGSQNGQSMVKIYGGTEHGLPMFGKNPDLEPAIVSWLEAQLLDQD